MIFDMKDIKSLKIGVIGLGYVGPPLSVEFGKKYSTLWFDINTTRIKELTSGIDRTLALDQFEIYSSINLRFSNTVEDLSTCNA
jgi:UDP-N-acetyl-D-galactosamine dehydrogenase